MLDLAMGYRQSRTKQSGIDSCVQALVSFLKTSKTKQYKTSSFKLKFSQKTTYSETTTTDKRFDSDH
jgi:hypothetical protein